MPSETPLVSVVTPTFNAGRYLRDTIESVLSQDHPNIEYLVVDSYSTDNTPEILDRYAGRLRIIRVHRLGPASAIHIGFSQARGSILAWLNADDKYETAAISSGVRALVEQPETAVVYGDAWWIDENGRAIRPYPTIPFDADVLARDCFICQPAAFIRASAYRECALDPSLPVSFDYDLWIRLAALRRRFQYVPQQFAYSRMHRECLTLSHRREVFEVTMDLLNRHYGYIPVSWIFGYLSHRRDGRDQFFEPLRPSMSVFAASLAFGLGLNRTRVLRFMRDWVSTAYRGLGQRLAPPPRMAPRTQPSMPKVERPADIR